MTMVKRGFVRALLALLFICVPAVGNVSADDLEKGLGRDLRESRAIVVQATEKLRAGGMPTSEITHLKSIADNVRAAHLLMEELFRLREEKAAVSGGKAVDRQNAVAGNYTKAIDDYLALIDALPPDNTVTQSSLDALKTLLDKIVTPKKRPLLGALPYKHPAYPPREPATTPAVLPAYKGGNRDVTAADIAASAEAPVSKEIADLAQSLQWNPVLIYEWVKNNVETEWYWGVMKGAEETLHQKSGNDADQAALLAALLRASGYPSRFVKGTIEFFPDIDKVKNLTGLTDPMQIAAFFQKAGIAFKPVIAGGGIANFQVEHIWVESRIPYANYRGAVIDDQGKTWLGLDTSVKPQGYTRNTPLDIPADVTAPVRDDYLSANQDKTPLEFLQGKVKDYLDVNRPGKTWQDALSTRTIIPDVLKIIPASLQFKVIAVTGEYTELPAELRHQVKFTAKADGNDLYSITLETQKLTNKRVILTYEPETVEDQQIIDSYGGLDNTPSYLVRLRPVLTLDGERQIVATDGLPMGGEYTLTIDVVTPNGTETITSAQIVGNLTAIGIVGGKAAALSPVADSDDAQTLLHKEAISYIDRWNRAEDQLAAFYKVAQIRPLPAVVIVGGLIDVTYILDTPHDFQWKGVFIDAILRGIEVVGNATGEKEFMRLSSLQGSVLENRIFEDDFKVESISTAKLLHLANVDGTPLVNIDKTNVTDVLPTLPFDDNVKADIANAVNQGLTVTIPRAEIGYEDWSGIGYIKENPETGESGWMLTGMVAGGMTVWTPDQWDEDVAKAMSYKLRYPYSGQPNTDPLQVALIVKIPITDMQTGPVGKKLKPALQVKVVDKNWKPVQGASVTFKIKAGGGSLDDKGETTVTKTTNRNGIASAALTLGQHTADNPSFWITEGNTYSDQYGANVIDATLDSGIAITTPFTAYGKPGPVDHLRQTYGDKKFGRIHSFAGFVSLLAEDGYGNPIANNTITFSLGTPVDKSTCGNPNSDDTSATLVKTDDPCINSSPTTADLGSCKTAAQSIDVISSSTGAAVEVILGGSPETSYPIKAKSKIKTLAETVFTLTTFPFGNCSGTAEPSYQLTTTYVIPSDNYGHNINAARSGTTIPLFAKLYALKERKETIDEQMCGGPLTCSKIVGGRIYEASSVFTASSARFDGQLADSKGGGTFQYNYVLKTGINNIRIDGHGEFGIQRTKNTCSGCSGVINETLALDDYTYLQVYGIDIAVKRPLQVMLSPDGFSRNNLKITYTINPAEYTAFSTIILLYKNNEIIDYIPTETSGKGFGTIARGYQFDEKANYQVQVVLNYGTGVEIKGDLVPLIVVKGVLVPDYNHNRKIDQDDIDRSLNGDTYYFWINDDDGTGDTEGTGIPGTRPSFPLLTTPYGTRDLVDWFPVRLDIADLLTKFDPSSYTYNLRHEELALRFIYSDLSPIGSGDYLTNVPTARNIVEKSVVQYVPSTVNMVHLDSSFLGKITRDSKGIVLIEALINTQKPLLLEVFNNAGQKVFEASMQISVDGVEQMFRHKNFIRYMKGGNGPVPEHNSKAGGEPDRFLASNDQPTNFPDSEINNDVNLVALHGYNVDGQEARGFHAEMFKRLYWSGSRAKFWAITWYGAETKKYLLNKFTPDYHANVVNAFDTAPLLKDFLNYDVKGDIAILGHSLGNMVVSSMLSDNYQSWDDNFLASHPTAKIRNYFMVDAAVAIEAYDGAANKNLDMLHNDWVYYKQSLWSSEWYQLFARDNPPDNRAKLTWRDRFKNRPVNTAYYNFFSSGEEVLGALTLNTPITQILVDEAQQLGSYAWAVQEKLKGGNPIPIDIIGHSLGGWGFNFDDTEYFTTTYSELGIGTNVPIPPTETNNIDDIALKGKPFFKKGTDLDLYLPGITGSTYAANNMNRLMADGMPALTLPMGGNEIIIDKLDYKFDLDNNYDMQSRFKNANKDWPQIREDKQNWRHSDLMNVSYPFVHNLFDTLVSLGGLK
jgi:transglutaminase-like putative cysteine protease